jgi:hypothetical protein
MQISYWSMAGVSRSSRLIGSYICSWERPGDLPRVIEILCLFASGAQRNEQKETKISFWRGSLGVRDSESCWFTEEICTCMHCCENPGDLPLVKEIFVSFCSFRCAPLAKRHKISITRGRSPGLSQEHM